MKRRHIAFTLEHAYGHILPTLGIAMELIRRGHQVSYAVTEDFAPGIRRIGASARLLNPLVTRPALLDSIVACDRNRRDDIRRQKTEDSLRQLESLYVSDKPDAIIHDACEDVAGRSLALKWGIPHIRFCPVPLKPDDEGNLGREFETDSVILVSVPRFFVEKISVNSNARVKLLGFIPEGRTQFFTPWEPTDDGRKVILVSVTTGILPQVEFCKMAISAFQNSPWRIVLSIGGFDRVSRISTTDLGELPENVELNHLSSNFDILHYASLFITQGGQGSILEALYCGVPILGVPSYFWDEDACRVATELGLGTKMPFSEASAVRLRECASILLDDFDTLRRTRSIQQRMREDRGAELAADIIDAHLHGEVMTQ